MYQARMYGLWFAAAAWFCAYSVFAERRSSRFVIAGGCVLAALLVTVHWFGIIVLALVSGSAIIVRRARPAERRADVWPFLTGVATVLAFMPFIQSQRST